MNGNIPKSYVWYRAIGARFRVTCGAGLVIEGVCIAATASGELTLQGEDTVVVQVGGNKVEKLEPRRAPVPICHHESTYRHWDGWQATEHSWYITGNEPDFVLPAT